MTMTIFLVSFLIALLIVASTFFIIFISAYFSIKENNKKNDVNYKTPPYKFDYFCKAFYDDLSKEEIDQYFEAEEDYDSDSDPHKRNKSL